MNAPTTLTHSRRTNNPETAPARLGITPDHCKTTIAPPHMPYASVKAVMTVDEFCLEYGIGRTSAYAELKSGRLKAKKRGDTTLIPRTFAEEWLAALPDYTPAQ